MYVCGTRVDTERKGDDGFAGEQSAQQRERDAALLSARVCTRDIRMRINALARVYVCARVCVLVACSRTNAQYAAACAHRRIGRPRGDATALRHYNYLRAPANGYFAAVVYGN